jgi:hypothetical protein
MSPEGRLAGLIARFIHGLTPKAPERVNARLHFPPLNSAIPFRVCADEAGVTFLSSPPLPNRTGEFLTSGSPGDGPAQPLRAYADLGMSALSDSAASALQLTCRGQPSLQTIPEAVRPCRVVSPMGTTSVLLLGSRSAAAMSLPPFAPRALPRFFAPTEALSPPGHGSSDRPWRS